MPSNSSSGARKHPYQKSDPWLTELGTTLPWNERVRISELIKTYKPNSWKKKCGI